jgi:hypothetical protein
MMVSRFDEMLHTFRCENPQCGETFQHLLRRLLDLKEVVCPKCGTAIDIRESKRTGEIGLDFATASEIDKQRMEKK